MKTLVTTTQIDTSNILSKPYLRRLMPDPVQGYTASIQEFPGCIAEGDTADEALANLDKAADSWLQVSLLNGRAIPEPVDFDGYSGKVALRIPKSLHRQTAELAEMEGCSINQILNTAIASYVSGKSVVNHVSQRLLEVFPLWDRFNNQKHWQMFSLVDRFEMEQISGMPTRLYGGGTFTSISSAKPKVISLESNHG